MAGNLSGAFRNEPFLIGGETRAAPCYPFNMVTEFSRSRLADLLVDPREDLDFEIKNWLDLKGSNHDKATLAKAVLALANHGGGFIALGLTETHAGIVEAPERPATLDGYGQDLINGIVQKYCDPPFHCSVHIVPDEAGALFPIVHVPGGHRVPVRACRAGPNGKVVQSDAIYIRKPGPRSETPQTALEWDGILARCLRNRRDEMLDQIRDLVTGVVPQVDEPVETDRLEDWIASGIERWNRLVQGLPEGAGPRFPHGHFCFAYEIRGERRQFGPADVPALLRASAVRHTGWPPFWYPTREGIEPYPMDGAVECWLGNDPRRSLKEHDAAHSDFWRIHPEGLAFLLRGYQEDTMEEKPLGPTRIGPATAFDISLPVWRVGEAMLHAQSLAAKLFEGPTSIRFMARYSGLDGRCLISVDPSRSLPHGQVARQHSISLVTHVEAQAIDANLPEIVHPFWHLFTPCSISSISQCNSWWMSWFVCARAISSSLYWVR